MNNKKCKFCESSFESKNKRQLFCCKKCREKHWVKNNSERDKELKKKSRLKLNPVFCKRCENPIPNEERKGGKIYCNECLPELKKAKLKKQKEFSRKAARDFLKYKESIGCSQCGYNEFGGSLDFHHTDAKKKERRIDCKSWYYQTDLFKKEFKKCILVCKNCHYKIHHEERKIQNENHSRRL